MARKMRPKREKAEEKENASAQYPIPVGTVPPPKRNPMNMTTDTAAVLKREGKITERIVKPTGNKQAVAAAWKNIRTGVITAP